jgi:hypothetical protein
MKSLSRSRKARASTPSQEDVNADDDDVDDDGEDNGANEDEDGASRARAGDRGASYGATYL